MNTKIINLTGRLYFNHQNGRWGIVNSDDLWGHDGLHCGELIEWYNSQSGEWLEDCIEGIYAGDKPQYWYLSISGLKGHDLNGLKVRIMYT
jgi:hypothetical protein